MLGAVERTVECSGEVGAVYILYLFTADVLLLVQCHLALVHMRQWRHIVLFFNNNNNIYFHLLCTLMKHSLHTEHFLLFT